MATDAGVEGSVAGTGMAADAPVGAHGRRRLMAQSRFLIALGLVIGALLLWFRSGFSTPPDSIASGPLPLVLTMLSALTYSSVGLLLTLRRPEVRIGTLEAWMGVLVGAIAFAWGYLALAERAAAGAAAAPYVGLVVAVFTTPVVAALAIIVGLLFPTDRLLTRSWRWVVWLTIVGAAAASLGRLFRPGSLTFVGRYDNPLGTQSLGVIPEALQVLGFTALGIGALLTGWSLIQRHARADATQRAQLRVFTALAILQSLAFALFIAPFVFPGMPEGGRDLVVVVNLLVFALGPLTIALACARYRLYAIDQLVGHTFVYGALTAILAGLYAASIKLFTDLFTWLIGESSNAALVITTLILATTFTPIKARLEGVVARWRPESAGPMSLSGATVGASAAEPPPGSDRLLADPRFAAALDERIRNVIRDERSTDRL